MAVSCRRLINGGFGPLFFILMHIYLKHPIHGKKIAVLDIEAEKDKELGWEEFDPSEKIEQTVAKLEVDGELEVNELKTRRRRKLV